MNNQYFFIPFMLIVGFFLLYIGLKIIIDNKPIIISSKWLFIMIIIMYIPLLIVPTVIDFLNSEIVYFETSLVFILFIVLVVYMRRILNGYQLIRTNEISSVKMPGFFYTIVGIVATVFSVYELLKI